MAKNNVIIKNGVRFEIAKYLNEVAPKCTKAVIITDNNVFMHYEADVVASLESAGINVKTFIMQAGEKNKNIDTYAAMINFVADAKLSREDVIIALGGGVVGDLAGFVAATYMRGIKVIQMPTTLLACIDSSIGGKTGFDLPQGKNLIGAFHQPSAILIDLETLKTLPKEEFQNGLGEGIKYAFLIGNEMIELLKEGLEDGNLLDFVTRCVDYKLDIVNKDEKESGLRKLLNLGHTLGHAIEKESNYTIPHGLAVTKGTLCVANASVNYGKLQKQAYLDAIEICKKYDLDYTISYDIKTLLKNIQMDKKMHSDGDISFVDINGVGNCIVRTTSIKELEEYLTK